MRAAFLSTAFIIAAVMFQNHATAAGLAKGSPAPAFTLKDLAGNSISLEEQKGRVILLYFWSTQCAPCTAEMPSLKKLYAAFKNKDFEIIAVSIDPSARPVKEFALLNYIGFTLLLDPDKKVSSDLYACSSLPMSYLIDQRGTIIDTFIGARQWNTMDLKKKIRRLLDKK